MLRRLLLCFACVALAGCGGDAKPVESACGEIKAEPLDPGSGQHLLPGAPEPTFNTDPPTSGAHAPGTHPSGVLTTPIPRPVQVAMLENGEVLIQYGEISSEARRSIENLVAPGNHVTVAPNPALPSPIVATAWQHMLRCERADRNVLKSFVDALAGRNAGH